MQSKRPKRKKSILPELIEQWHTDDPLGSYTGTPNDGTEPTQDADDL